MAAKQDYFGPGDYLVLLIFALVVFAIVIFHILTLGRPDRTLRPSRANHRQGGATAGALQRRLESPNLKGTPINSLSAIGDTVSAHTVGYLQRVDMLALRTCAQGSGCRIALAVVPGSFITPGRAGFRASGDDACNDLKAGLDNA